MEIPKIIHQIWLGREMPMKFKHFAESWKNQNKDWKYILWDEQNIKLLKYLKSSDYERLNNFSEKSDYLRFCIIGEYGGVYVDTDFECLKPLENLIKNTKFFIGITEKYLNTGLFGATPEHPILHDLLDKTPERILTHKNQNSFYKLGPAFVDEVVNNSQLEKLIVPRNIFYPFTRFDLINKNNAQNSYAIHHYAMSWNKVGKIKAFMVKTCKYIFRFLARQF